MIIKIGIVTASNDEPPLSWFNHPGGETLDVFEFIARVLTQILRQQWLSLIFGVSFRSRLAAMHETRMALSVARKISFMQVEQFTFGNFPEFLAFGGLDVLS